MEHLLEGGRLVMLIDYLLIGGIFAALALMLYLDKKL